MSDLLDFVFVYFSGLPRERGLQGRSPCSPSERVFLFPKSGKLVLLIFHRSIVYLYVLPDGAFFLRLCLEVPRERGLQGRSPCSPSEREAPRVSPHTFGRVSLLRLCRGREAERPKYRAGR